MGGGLMRVDRLSQQLCAWGHDTAFLKLSTEAVDQRATKLPILSLTQAKSEHWDFTLLPGAGFPTTTIQKFSELKSSNFGTRVQLILNDLSRIESFLAASHSFAPDITIANTPVWDSAAQSAFKTKRFYILEGAVDTSIFAPKPYRTLPEQNSPWRIGGLANKNPLPLIEALRKLPDRFQLILFGPDRHNLKTAHSDLIQTGRLSLVGKLNPKALTEFYHQVDCICMTELFAGWANLVAESMASGVPVVCTEHGTQAIAYHEKTALLLLAPTARNIKLEISKLAEDPDLCAKLAQAARKHIISYSWDIYAQNFLRLLTAPPRKAGT